MSTPINPVGSPSQSYIPPSTTASSVSSTQGSGYIDPSSITTTSSTTINAQAAIATSIATAKGAVQGVTGDGSDTSTLNVSPLTLLQKQETNTNNALSSADAAANHARRSLNDVNNRL